MFCQNCGQPQQPGFVFCSRCGCKLIKPQSIPTPEPEAAPAEVSCEPVTVEESVTAAPAADENISVQPEVRPAEVPAGPSAASVSYAPPVQPAPYPQYSFGYPGAAPQYPAYPYYGVPTPPYPQNPYAPNPYIPYNPYPFYSPYPGVPQQPNTPPVNPPVVEDVPPAKKGRRRIPILIMALLILVGALLFFFGPDLPRSSGQEASAQSETPWFRNEDGTLYFDARLYTGPSELTIPETVDGQRVVSIAQDCFAGNETITTVVLPDTIEEIGSGAFAGCTALRGIFIPEGVKLIGSGAFEDCSSLEAIHIPASVAAIGRNTFRGCSKLAYIMHEGTYEDWYALYASYISSKTTVYCSDGTFPQGRIIP